MKNDIIKTMMKGMDESLNKDFNDSKCKLDENTRDIFRAFKMIISQFSVEEVKEKMKVEVTFIINMLYIIILYIRFQRSKKRCLILCGL